jgi:hypothetical protein
MSLWRSVSGVLLAALLASCASHADLASPPPSMAEQDPKGCVVRMTLQKEVVNGELIGVHHGRYILQNGAELLGVDTGLAVKRATVVLGRVSEKPNGYMWSAFLPLISISHGYFGLFTLPMNIITAVAVNTGAAKSRNVIYMEPVIPEDLCRFARFPQGIPTAYFEGKRWAH